MIGWILAGLAAATVGKVLLDSDNNYNTNKNSNTNKNNGLILQCPFCDRRMSVSNSLERHHYTCGGCHRKFVVDRRMVIKNLMVVQCSSCGRDVEMSVNSNEAKCEHCGAICISDKGKVYQNNTINTQSTTAKSTSQNSKANKDKGIRVNLNKPLMQIIEGKIVSSQYAIVSKNKVYFDNNDTVLYINIDSSKYEFTDHNKVNIQIEKTLTSNDLSFGLINTAGVFAQYKSNSLPYNFDDVCSTMSYQANKEFGLETKFGICMTLTSNGIKFRYNGKYINIEEAIKIVSDEKNKVAEPNNIGEFDDSDRKEGNKQQIQNTHKGGYYVYAPKTGNLNYKDAFVSMLVETWDKGRISFVNEKENKLLGIKAGEEISAQQIAAALIKHDPFICSVYFKNNDITFFYSLHIGEDNYLIILLSLLENEKYKVLHAFAKGLSNNELYDKCDKFLYPKKIKDLMRWEKIIGTIMGRIISGGNYNDYVFNIDTSFEDYISG